MKIKNVSGAPRYFAAGGRGVSLANNATGNVPDTPEAVADVLRAVARKELEIIEAPVTTVAVEAANLPEGYRLNVNTVADTNTITVQGVTFEFDNNSTVTAGNTAVTFSSDATALTNLKAAINANATLKAAKIFATDIDTTAKYLVIARTNGDLSTDMTVTKSGSPLTITKIDGVDNTGKGVYTTAFTATGVPPIHIHTGLKTIEHFIVNVRDATGVAKAYNGAVTTGGGTLYLATGSTNIAATDVVTVVAFGVRG